MIFVDIVEDVIEVEKLSQLVASPACGAACTFVGSVRERNHGKAVSAVSYDIFAPLARNVFKALANEAQQQCDHTLRIAVVHRCGRLAVGDVSVAIVVASPHRKEAFSAANFIIEAIKTRAPIWKKEHYFDGETEWLQGHALCQHRANSAELNFPQIF